MFIKIEKILYHNLKKSGIKQKIDEQQILDIAVEVIAEIVGQQANVQIKPLRITDGVLYLACLSDLFKQRCKNYESKIVYELNRPFFKQIVAKIIFET